MTRVIGLASPLKQVFTTLLLIVSIPQLIFGCWFFIISPTSSSLSGHATWYEYLDPSYDLRIRGPPAVSLPCPDLWKQSSC